MGSCKALDHKCNVGFREGLRGISGHTRGGRCQEAKQALNAGAAEALGRDVPEDWDTMAARGEGGISIPEGSPECLEDWWSPDRYRKEARTAWFGERENVKEVSICSRIFLWGMSEAF